MKTVAFALAASLVLALSGCCSCGEQAPVGPKRPGDVVRDLRDAISAEHWAEAKACFTDNVQLRHGEAMSTGAFFRLRLHRDIRSDGTPCPCVDHGEGIEWVEVANPIGPADVVLAVDVKDGEARVTIEPAIPAHLRCPQGVEGKPTFDLRDRVLVLVKEHGTWKIVDNARQRAYDTFYKKDEAEPGCTPEAK